MIYILLSILILIAIAFGASFYMYIQDKRHARSAQTKSPRMAEEVPSYQLSSWIDDEVAARKLYKNTSVTAALANELRISERRLKHTINNAYNKTVAEYLIDRRIQAAFRMLREQPEMALDEISSETGFASQNTFYMAFKDIMGQTPEQYRNMTNRKIEQIAEAKWRKL